MLEFQEIKEIIKQVNDSNIAEFSLKHGPTEIKIKRNSDTTNVIQTTPTNVVVAQPTIAPQQVEVKPTSVVETQPSVVQNTAKEENLHKVTSPMVGTFYASPSPDASNYVVEGSKVEKNTVVCIVEAMKLFNEIEADVKGEIVEVLVENGQLVEYGQPLFLVRP